MPRDVSGTYTAPTSSWNPAVQGTTVDEDDWNDLLGDIETALTNSPTVASSFGTDNVLLRSDGTGKGMQSTGIVVSDTNNFTLPNSTNAAKQGILYKGNNTFLHNFAYGANGTVTVNGLNTFLGEGAGNLTMGSTATLVTSSSGGVDYSDQASVNTGIGYLAGNALTTGHHNAFFGAYSGLSMTTGDSNTFIGTSSGYNSQSTQNCVFVGFRAGLSVTSATRCLLFGTAAGNSLTSAPDCVLIGVGAGYFITTNGYTVAIGGDCLLSATGSSLVGIGYAAGYDNTSGANNTYVGYNSGRGITTGSGNTVIGAQITGLSSSLSNSVVIGAGNGSVRFLSDSAGSIILGTGAPTTSATGGFVYVPACAGTPTGVPTASTGRVPIVVDSTNNKLYFYSGGAWRDAGP